MKKMERGRTKKGEERKDRIRRRAKKRRRQ